MNNAGILLQYLWKIHKYCCNISGHFKDVDGIFLDSASILMENFWTVQGYCCNISGHCRNIVTIFMTNAGILVQYFWTIHIDGILYISGVKSRSG